MPKNNTFRLSLMISALILGLLAAPLWASNTGSGSSAPNFSNPGVDIAEIYREGIEQFTAGDYKAAERSMKRVTRVATKDANSHYVLGLSQIGLEKWRSASSSLKKAVRYDEELYDARAQLGFTYMMREKPDDAAEELEELHELQAECGENCPEDLTKAVLKLEEVMASDAEKAVGFAPDSVEFSLPVGEFAYLDAVRLINLERYAEAIAQLRDAHQVYGPHPDVLTYLGFAYRKSGDLERAVAYYDMALTVAPDHLNANEYLGEYYVERGNMPAARAQLAKLEQLCAFGCAQLDELQQWIAAAEA